MFVCDGLQHGRIRRREEKRTEKNLIVRTGISEAETTNNKRLRSTFCIEAIYYTDTKHRAASLRQHSFLYEPQTKTCSLTKLKVVVLRLRLPVKLSTDRQIHRFTVKNAKCRRLLHDNVSHTNDKSVRYAVRGSVVKSGCVVQAGCAGVIEA